MIVCFCFVVVATGGFFINVSLKGILLAILCSVTTTILQGTFQTLFAPWGVPTLTFPFCFGTLPFLFLQGAIPGEKVTKKKNILVLV